jgi:uncharacterized protein YkwD
MSKIIFPALVALLLFSFLASLPARSSAAPLSANPASASELLQLVNGLRAANGLPAYKANSALMAAAQSHSEYQAATGNTSHTGKGGSRPRDRAVAWGYGGGSAVYVSENIATGTNLSASEAVGWWQGDGLHLGTMLSSKYRDAGAGVAEANGVVYYTLDVGYVAGDESSPPAAQPGQGGNPGSAPASPVGTPVAVVIPVVAATPHTDGSITHEVQEGQALWSISAVYKVSLPYLLTLNGLKEDTLIYPGDKLLIRPPRATPTPEASPTQSPTETPAASNTLVKAQTTPTQNSPATQTVDAQAASTALAKAPSQGTPPLAATPMSEVASGSIAAAEAQSPPGILAVPASQGIDPLLMVIGGLVVIATLLLLLGRWMQRGA